MIFAAAGTQTVNLTGIPSAEAFGSPSITLGAVTVDLTGIPSAEAFGALLAVTGQAISLTGIPSAEAFGALSIIYGTVTVQLTGIPSAEAFGVLAASLVDQITVIAFRAKERGTTFRPSFPREGDIMSNPVYVEGSPYVMESQEILPITLDASPLLDPGETPTDPTATITNLLTGASEPAKLSGSVSVLGTKLTQRVQGLDPATRYRLAIHFAAIAGVKEWTMAIDLHCGF